MNQPQRNESMKSSDEASFEPADLLERLKQPNANPTQFLADMLAKIAKLGTRSCMC